MLEAVVSAIWTAALDASQLPLPRPVVLIPSSGLLLATDGEALYAFRLDTGARVWKTPAVGDMFGGFVVSGTSVYVSDGPLIRALRVADGSQLWLYENTGDIRQNLRPPVICGSTVIAVDTGATLRAVTAASGRQLWVRQHTTSVTSYLTADAQTAYYAGDGALRAVDAVSGTLKWSFTPQEAGSYDSEVVVAGGWVFASFGQGYALDPVQGQPSPRGPKTFANHPGQMLTGLAVDPVQGIALYGDGQGHAFAHRYWADLTAFYPDPDGAFQPGSPPRQSWPVWDGTAPLLCLRDKYRNQTVLSHAVPNWGTKTLTATGSVTLGQDVLAPPVVAGGVTYLLTRGDPAMQPDFHPQVVALRMTT